MRISLDDALTPEFVAPFLSPENKRYVLGNLRRKDFEIKIEHGQFVVLEVKRRIIEKRPFDRAIFPE